MIRDGRRADKLAIVIQKQENRSENKMERMICVEGYKAFHGKMRIVPKTVLMQPFEIEGDWLYKPESDCWYGGGSSYPASICYIVGD